MRVLVAGWFSFSNGHATAGDLLSRDLVCRWLEEVPCQFEVAVAPPFQSGIDWRKQSPRSYDYIIFVCGPWDNGELEHEFCSHFQECPIIGMNLSMIQPLDQYNPFVRLFERDSSRAVNPDLVFATRQELVPVVGVCLVEDYPAGRTEITNPAIERLLARREVSVVPIDTRLDENQTGQRTPAEIESLLARMDAVVTTRLHGMVLSLKNSVPVVGIDPEPGGFKITRQAKHIGWPHAFAVDELTDEKLDAALQDCLTEAARQKARQCADRATSMLGEVEQEFQSFMRDLDD